MSRVRKVNSTETLTISPKATDSFKELSSVSVKSKRVRTEDTSEEASIKSDDSDNKEDRLIKMASAIKTVLECLGEDVDREGLERTPMRAAKALQFFTSGYCQTVSDVVGEGVFNEETQGDMVVVRNIEIHSLCEHHMVPFSGKVHIAYIPQGRILGLSKLARIANLFSRRLQVQERLTRQIAEAIMETVGAKGVGVTVECTHMCMVMRGVEKQGASTVTSTVLGNFETDKQVRQEYFQLINSTR